jgi:rare lipoprotein A
MDKGSKAQRALARRACAALLAGATMIIAGCGSVPKSPDRSADGTASRARSPGAPMLPRAGSGRGGYYQDDGPADVIPENLLAIPDAEPKIEPYLRSKANQPYVVFGKTYTPILDDRPLVQRGRGSWYGRKFHGQRTSSGEPYDMFAMTAAHPTLPIPSYVRVTNLANGNRVIVKVNDRGPFHSDRIIDLSYTAAYKLGYLGSGSANLQVERLLPDEIRQMEAARRDGNGGGGTQLAAASNAAPAGALVPVAASPAQLAAAPQPGEASGVNAPDTAAVSTEAVPMPQASVSVEAAPLPAAVAPPAPQPSAQTSPAAGGFYVQLGAFSRAENAQAVRQRFAQSGLPSVDMAQANGIYRVFGGPYASRAEAESAARRLQLGGSMPIIVQR